jgi:hypothetical protein
VGGRRKRAHTDPQAPPQGFTHKKEGKGSCRAAHTHKCWGSIKKIKLTVRL